MIISNYCTKGGVGKTTITCLLGEYMATLKKSVCIVSIDDQNNVFDAFDKEIYLTDNSDYIDNLLSHHYPLRDNGELVDKFAFELKSNVIAYKTNNTFDMVSRLQSNIQYKRQLNQFIDHITKKYDIVMFDFPRTPNYLTELLLKRTDIICLIIGVHKLELTGLVNTLQVFKDTRVSFDLIKAVIPNKIQQAGAATDEMLRKLEIESNKYLPNAKFVHGLPHMKIVEKMQCEKEGFFGSTKGLSKYDISKLKEVRSSIINIANTVMKN